MVAKMQYDKGISVNGHSQFNYDGVARSFISEDEARAILNYNIEKRPCHTEDGLVIPRMNYLRRSDGGIIDANCSVGEEFEVTCQPLETLEIAQYIMSRIQGLRIDTVASMYNGGTTFITLSYGDSWLVKGDSSPHFTNIVLNNPLTRGKIHLVQSLLRVVCENTLAMACKNGEGYRIAHTTNARAMFEAALKGMEIELREGQRAREMCEYLASKPITVGAVNRLLDKIYPLPIIEEGKSTRSLTLMKGKRDEVLAQFEKDDSFTDKSFYTFYSANSYLIEHPLHKQERTDNAQIAFENMVGNRSRQKSEIFDAVWEEAMLVA